MKLFNILNRAGNTLGQMQGPSRRQALASAKRLNELGDSKWRGAYRAEFVKEVCDE